MGGEPTEILRAALDQSTDTVDVTLTISRGIAEKLVQLLEAEQSAGAVVVPVKDLYTTTEASGLLGISRASLMKLIDSHTIEAVKVGSHHRIPSEELVAFQRARQVSQSRSTELLTEFSARATTNFQSNLKFRMNRQGEE